VSVTAAASGPGFDGAHSVIARAGSHTQLGLGSFQGKEATPRTPTRLGGGRFQVQELEVKSALTSCQLSGNPWSLNPYAGCSHACAYCYVPDVAHLERRRWGSYVVVKRNLPTVLARELKRKEPRDVFLSSATDPYQPIEGAMKITRRCLELLLHANWPVRVLTRNPLVLRDLDLLSSFDDISVGMSVPTFDEEARRIIEPGAPPVQARLRALSRLADAGLEPYVNLAPCYPLSGGLRPDDVAEMLRDAGVAVAYFAPWRYMEGVRPALARHVEGTGLSSFQKAVEDPGYMGRLYRSLEGAMRRAGVPFQPMDGAGRRARRRSRVGA
jgi:DNA repair photolyase